MRKRKENETVTEVARVILQEVSATQLVALFADELLEVIKARLVANPMDTTLILLRALQHPQMETPGKNDV